jgi:uncharacterized membrane protein
MPRNITKESIIVFVQILLTISLLGVALSITRYVVSGNAGLSFLPWNLALAWMPLVFAWFLFNRTNSRGLSWSKINLALIALWLVFLPNSFYLMTDFIHLKTARGIEPMFDVVLLMTYSIAGLALGFMSLFLVHLRTLQRFGKKGHYLALFALLASGFAIYLGRYLRWNSWDVVLNPFGILVHITDRVLHPTEHILTFGTTILYFVFLSILYWAIWRTYIIATSK